MRRALLLSVLAFAPIAAQTPLPANTPVHAAPGGPAIGTLRRGTSVRTGGSANGWTSIVIDGWILTNRLNTRRDSLDRTVNGNATATLRTADGMGQPIIVDIEPGTNVKRVSERNGWTQVRRSAWIRSSALQAPAVRSATTPRTGSKRAAADTAEQGSSQRTTRATTMRSAPGGEERASVRAATSVETLAHEGGWARVRIEGWIAERDLMIADSSADIGLSAADLRAEPAAHRGKIVRWEVQVIAVQRADPLRRALAPDEPYLLARGPGDEGAVLYIAIPPSLLERTRALPQLSTITVTARVREGRSAPVGAPLLDLISFTKAP